VIVLDINQLEYAQPPDGPLLTMLQAVARQARHRLWLPEMAFEEHLSRYRYQVAEADRERAAATQKLRSLVRDLPAELPEFQVDQAVSDHAARLQRVFLILRAPDAVGREALLRAARRQLPARTALDGPGAGADDVAVWLTAVIACRDTGEETYFVSADNPAFGAEILRPELADELSATLGEHVGRFHFCAGFEGLLGQFATRLEQAPGRTEIARADPVRQAVRAALAAPALSYQLAVGAGLTGGFNQSMPGCQDLTCVAEGRSAAYTINDARWVCAQLTWLASKDFSVAYGGDVSRQVRVTFKLPTSIVMQLGEEGNIVAAEVSGRSQAFDVRRTAPGDPAPLVG